MFSNFFDRILYCPIKIIYFRTHPIIAFLQSHIPLKEGAGAGKSASKFRVS